MRNGAQNPIEGRLPDFIGVGGQRCGSTTIWSLLRGDDRLFLPDQKELHYFTDRDGDYREDISNYRAYFVGARAEQLVGEFTPNYLTSKIACERIQKHLPRAKIIITLRDPVARAISLYDYRVDRGMERRGIQKAIFADMARCKGQSEIIDRHHAYCQLSLFSDGVERYLQAFGTERVHVILMDDLQADPDLVRVKLGEFLGMESAVADSSKFDSVESAGWSNRTNTHPRSRLVQCVAKTIMRHVADRDSICIRFKRGIARRAIRLNSIPGKAPVSGGFETELRAFFREDTRRLGELLNRGLPWDAPETDR